MSNNEYYKNLAEDVMLEFTDTEIEEIAKNDDELKKLFTKVTKINTKNVKPLFYPYDKIHNFLRNDDETSVLDQMVILNNAPSVDGDFVTIVKVVK